LFKFRRARKTADLQLQLARDGAHQPPAQSS
jgi:hypothetical protein